MLAIMPKIQWGLLSASLILPHAVASSVAERGPTTAGVGRAWGHLAHHCGSHHGHVSRALMKVAATADRVRLDH